MKTRRIYSLNNFPLYHTAVLAIVGMLFISHPGIYLSYSWKFEPFDNSMLLTSPHAMGSSKCTLLSQVTWKNLQLLYPEERFPGILQRQICKFSQRAFKQRKIYIDTQRVREREKKTYHFYLLQLKWEEKSYFSQFFKQPTTHTQKTKNILNSSSRNTILDVN